MTTRIVHFGDRGRTRRFVDATTRLSTLSYPMCFVPFARFRTRGALTTHEAARDAGATQAFHVMLRLPAEVYDVFRERLQAAFPLRVDKVMSLVQSMRGGRHNDARFGSRMRGEGARYQLMADLFAKTAAKLGLTSPLAAESRSPFRRPHQEQWLFGEEQSS